MFEKAALETVRSREEHLDSYTDSHLKDNTRDSPVANLMLLAPTLCNLGHISRFSDCLR